MARETPPDPPSLRPPGDERRSGADRRRRDRRQIDLPVAYDRRSGHDRRTGTDRRRRDE